MILGRGLLATAFKNSFFDTARFVVFASGVSNSMEKDPKAYARELALLDASIAKNTTLIYFSTTSIFDPTKTETRYIHHKLQIEKQIRDVASSYLIVRLPILIGRTPNPYTLINFLVNAIIENRPVELHARACRHLLDIDDLIPLLIPYVADPDICHVLNIPGSQKIPVPELVAKIQTILHKEGIFTWQDTGGCYDIPAENGETLYLDRNDYVDEILNKYLTRVNV